MPTPHLPVVLLIGATAVGKDEVALPLAESLDAEIVSVDSIKVYRGMDIGTAKPGSEERRRVPHHLLDLAEPWESYSVGRFLEDADRAVTDIRVRGRRPLLVGGSGLYLRAFLEGLVSGPAADPDVRRDLTERAIREGLAALHAELARVDPAAAARIHPNDRKRIVRALEVHALTGEPITARQIHAGRRRAPQDVLLFGVTRPRAELQARACARVDALFAAGLVDEVRRLLAGPRGIGPQASEAIGYRELIEALRAGTPLDAAREAIQRDTCRFIKRQETWFRRFPDTRWFTLGSPVAAAAAIRDQASRPA